MIKLYNIKISSTSIPTVKLVMIISLFIFHIVSFNLVDYFSHVNKILGVKMKHEKVKVVIHKEINTTNYKSNENAIQNLMHAAKESILNDV